MIRGHAPAGGVMGKGDKRTKRGKLYRGTFGKSRPKKNKRRKKQAQDS